MATPISGVPSMRYRTATPEPFAFIGAVFMDVLAGAPLTIPGAFAPSAAALKGASSANTNASATAAHAPGPIFKGAAFIGW
jgi:hypothetical protein